MNHLGHLLVGLVLCSAAILALGLQATPQLLAVIAVGALLPDADHHKAKAFKAIIAVTGVGAFFLSLDYFKKIVADNLIAHAYSLAAAIAAVALIYLIKPKHRGVTHSILALAVYAGIVFAATSSLNLTEIAALAYGSHLIADKEIKII